MCSGFQDCFPQCRYTIFKGLSPYTYSAKEPNFSNHGWISRQCSFNIVYDIIEPGERRVIYEDSGLTVETFPLYHRLPCSGFIFREKPKLRHLRGDMVKFLSIPISLLQGIKEGADYVKPDGIVIPNDRLTTPPDPSVSYAYCSDTMYNPRVVKDIAGVNTVYHEATYHSSLTSTAKERGHSTASEAATVARDAGASRLIIGHFSKRYIQGEKPLLDEAAAIFPSTILANEGLRIDLE